MRQWHSENMHLRHFHVGIKLLPNVDGVIDHVRLAEDVEFRMQQLVLVVNL